MFGCRLISVDQNLVACWAELCPCSSTAKSSKEGIITEMKSEKSDEAVLLQGVNGEKQSLNDQVSTASEAP